MSLSQFQLDSFVPQDLTGRIKKVDEQYCEAGSFGDVYKCHFHSECGTVEEVAVKTFRFEFTLEDSDGRSARMIHRELGIWKRLSHPNVVPFLGTAFGFGRLGNASLVSLWMPNGTLQDFLHKYDDKLSIAHRLQLLHDISSGLQHLHSLSIVHGDLTSNNILIDATYNARLADFGYASLVGEIPEALAYLQMSTLRPGAVRWAAPECVSSNLGDITTKSDVYSFGNVALQVLSGRLPWSEFHRDAVVVVHLATGHKPRRPESRPIDDEHWQFIERCWSPVQQRPSAEQLISSILVFSLPYPLQPFYSLPLSWEGGGPQSSQCFSPLVPPNIEKPLPDIPSEVTHTSENFHPETDQSLPRLNLDTDSSGTPFLRESPTHAPLAGNQNSELDPRITPRILDQYTTMLPTRPPPVYPKPYAASLQFTDNSTGRDQLDFHYLPRPVSRLADRECTQRPTALSRDGRAATSRSPVGKGVFWRFFDVSDQTYTSSLLPSDHESSNAQTGVSFANMSSYLTPGDLAAVPLKRSRSDSPGHNDLYSSDTFSMVYPPSTQQEFINRQFLYPQETAPSIHGHSRRASPGSCGGGDDALFSRLPSQYPVPSASPRGPSTLGPQVHPDGINTNIPFPSIPPPTRSKSDTASSLLPQRWDSFSTTQDQLIFFDGSATDDSIPTVGLRDVLPKQQQHYSSSAGLTQFSFNLSNANLPLYNFNPTSVSSYLTPGDPAAVALKRSRSDSTGYDDLDISDCISMGCSPSPQQEFIDRPSLYPQETAPSIRGHSRRASSGSRGGGDGSWSASSSNRPSLYPGPSASPRVSYEDLPNVTPSSRPPSTLRLDAPPLTNGTLITDSKQVMTGERAAGASHRRRKQDANFLCPVPGCGSMFTRSFNLKGHMRSHNEERPFRCEWPGCGKRFVRRIDYKRHEKLHSNYRPFTCEECSKTFVRMDALNRHLRSEGGAGCQHIISGCDQGLGEAIGHQD